MVITLDLSGRNLSDNIPIDIRRLTHLQILNLRWNSFYGPLPAAIFELPSLTTLDINHNFLNSSFTTGIQSSSPSIFSTLTATTLRARCQRSSSTLQTSNTLEYLNLGGSYFEGATPSSYWEFPKLKSLYLRGNLLTGRISGQLGFSTQLEHVELGYNLYDGEIPGPLSRLSNLVYLDISSANLSGNLPDELGRLEKLETLLLYDNSLSGSILSGWARYKFRLDFNEAE